MSLSNHQTGIVALQLYPLNPTHTHKKLYSNLWAVFSEMTPLQSIFSMGNITWSLNLLENARVTVKFDISNEILSKVFPKTDEGPF